MSANPQSAVHELESVEHVEVFDTDWDDTLSTVPMEEVLSAATERVRGGKRTVAHTLQPHYPHVCRVGDLVVPVPGGFHPLEEPELEGVTQPQLFLTSTGYPLTRFKRSYEVCLKYAWAETKQVVDELVADGYTVAVTADHGELFGEYGLVEHPSEVRVPPLVDVPWVVFNPLEKRAGDGAREVKDQLRALGYAD
ncbi:alkaline phosphatase family protein [Halobellus captivus]|uniref:hypothetical protein n=1 Tax=Halobellus captivus TaxID=2592614 RepID=UPI0011A3139C|nr:hypothetical protein [Halobellus captivus]